MRVLESGCVRGLPIRPGRLHTDSVICVSVSAWARRSSVQNDLRLATRGRVVFITEVLLCSHVVDVGIWLFLSLRSYGLFRSGRKSYIRQYFSFILWYGLGILFVSFRKLFQYYGVILWGWFNLETLLWLFLLHYPSTFFSYWHSGIRPSELIIFRLPMSLRLCFYGSPSVASWISRYLAWSCIPWRRRDVDVLLPTRSFFILSWNKGKKVLAC